jgi:hypothetical protein
MARVSYCYRLDSPPLANPDLNQLYRFLIAYYGPHKLSIIVPVTIWDYFQSEKLTEIVIQPEYIKIIYHNNKTDWEQQRTIEFLDLKYLPRIIRILHRHERKQNKYLSKSRQLLGIGTVAYLPANPNTIEDTSIVNLGTLNNIQLDRSYRILHKYAKLKDLS